MKLTFVEKVKIGKMLREKSFSDINYYSFYDVSNKKSKYNDVDILEYLLDYVYETISKNEVINLNYLLKYIYSIKMFLSSIINYEQTDLITENYKNKLSALKVKYNEIREIYPEELNSKIDSEIDQINILLKGIKLEINEEEAIKAVDKKTKEDKLNKDIQKLTDEIKSLKKQNESLQKRIEKDTENKVHQSQIIDNNNHKIKLLEAKIKELMQNNDVLNVKCINLETECEKITLENNIKNIEINTMEKIISSQKETITAYEMSEKHREVALKSQEKIEFLAKEIFNMIMHVQMTSKEILNECNKKGFNTNMDEVKKALLYLQTMVKITNDKNITIPKVYKVENIKPVTNSSLFLTPTPNGYVDIMNISDLHIKNVDVDLCSELEKVYDYCDKEKIKLILNLGDFFGFKHSLKSLSEFERLLDDFTERLPENNEVMHAILGGNHDYFVTTGGFNVLEKLCSIKDGYLYLGYDHAKITFDQDAKNFFAIHHINKKIETDFINLFPDSDAYVNLIGHPHISKFDLINNNIFVPSLIKDRMSNGAIKLRIYFDAQGNINYMLFTLLKNENLGLVPVTEIPYKRILKKQTD